MTKIIENIELLKKLAPLLENVDTEYTFYNEYWYEHHFVRAFSYEVEWEYWCARSAISDTKMCDKVKTLVLEEAIDFIYKKTTEDWAEYVEEKLSEKTWCRFSVLVIFDIKMAEEILEYLLDNDLLWKIKKN